ncbi:hypothetical protein [Pseudonocardia broussonetiae]|uniref:Fenitrothion hydrolase n=1 Tax=Pseudonocardia broussonetiae TaxID=2736640 RepID=A0A6M6JLH6_9PSEU|nr:hypothetical protein [Pseudonocardia broussonetiae]QJY47910.1 hypothetical protein HOP40_20640 [Pseudonocardia broussonetiae]
MLLAHGVGTRSDLPVPAELAAVGAGLAVVISFAVLALRWRTARPDGTTAGRPLPGPIAAVLDSSLPRLALRVAGLLAATAVVVIGLFGPDDPSDNVAPWALYVTFWVGLVPASLLLGPVWRLLNPLRLLHVLVARVARIDPDKGLRRLPDGIGIWPAAASLGVFVWLELAHPDPANPRLVAAFVLGYSAVHVVAALVFGRSWFDRGDGFEVYSTLLGSLAPLGRRADGRLVLRNPIDGLGSVPAVPGLVAVVVVLVGSTAFDGLSRTSFWAAAVPDGPAWRTAGLVIATAAVAVLYLAATRRPDPGPGTGRAPLPAGYAPTLIPIAAGYAIAHYFSLLLFDGQLTIILASDPLGNGTDLFGTANRTVDYAVVGTTTIALVQLGAIVIGHLVATVSAHDRSLRMFPAPIATRVQYPLLAAMVALTCGAVGLVFAP